MRAAIATLVAAGVLIGTSAAAQEQRWTQTEETMPARLIEVGTWQFAATKRGPDGKPECFESWTFNADGTGLIVSGKQRVTTRWKADRFEDLGQFVFVTNETTTDGPDCMGRAIDKGKYPRKSPGFQLIFFDNGTRARVCDAGKLMTLPDGTTTTLLDADDCWGEIAPLSKG
jgi:hypothetical protein